MVSEGPSIPSQELPPFSRRKWCCIEQDFSRKKKKKKKFALRCPPVFVLPSASVSRSCFADLTVRERNRCRAGETEREVSGYT